MTAASNNNTLGVGLFDIRPIVLVVGILLVTLGIAMLLPALYDAAVSNPDWKVFLASAVVTSFFGVSMALMTWGSAGTMTLKQAFVLVPAVWVALVTFGALPFLFSELQLSITDAFFESMSGRDRHHDDTDAPEPLQQRPPQQQPRRRRVEAGDDRGARRGDARAARAP